MTRVVVWFCATAAAVNAARFLLHGQFFNETAAFVWLSLCLVARRGIRRQGSGVAQPAFASGASGPSEPLTSPASPPVASGGINRAA